MRALNLSDLWLPGDVLGGAMLEDYRGMATIEPGAGGGFGGSGSYIGLYRVPGGGGQKKHLLADAGFGTVWTAAVRLNFTRPEVRDRAVRVLGPDLLPIHAAELRGEITPGEAAGLVWCSVVRREAGLPVVHMLDAWADGDPRPGWFNRKSLTNRGGFISHDICWVSLGPDESSGRETGEPGRAAADAAAIAAGYALRCDDGNLLLPLPDGVVGRLETSNG